MEFLILNTGNCTTRGFFSYVNQVIKGVANSSHDNIFVDFIGDKTPYYDKSIKETNNVW